LPLGQKAQRTVIECSTIKSVSPNSPLTRHHVAYHDRHSL